MGSPPSSAALSTTNKKVRHEVGGGAPQAAKLAALQVQHDENVAAATADGLVAGVAAHVPVRSHVARAPTAVARVEALVADGNMAHMWQTTGAIAINGWEAFAVQDGIVAKEAKAAATKAAEQAAADEAVVVAAEALALQLGDKPDAAMNGKEITLAIKSVYVAVPQQSAPKSSHSTKAAGLAFLGGLGARWATPLPAARAACVAASAAASAAVAAADAAAAAAASLGPVAAPTVLPASNSAAAVDLDAMSEAEQRALLARLVDLQAAR